MAWHWAVRASLQDGTGHCGAGYKCNTAVPNLALSATWLTRSGTVADITLYLATTGVRCGRPRAVVDRARLRCAISAADCTLQHAPLGTTRALVVSLEWAASLGAF